MSSPMEKPSPTSPQPEAEDSTLAALDEAAAEIVEEIEEFVEFVGLPLEVIREEFVSVRELQRRILPDPERTEKFHHYEIFGRTLPLAIVGGDFYDFIDLEPRWGIKDKLGIVIADVSGHGLSAAMLMRDFNTALYTGISFQSHYVQDTTPLLFTKINRRMYNSSPSNHFISAFYGELHNNGTVRYMNAGHHPPVLFKKDRIERLDVAGPVMGVFKILPSPYEVGQAQLDPGDILFLFTDGLIEASGPGDEEFGLDRVVEIIQNNREAPMRKLHDQVIRELRRFLAGRSLEDDVTLIFIRAPATPPAGQTDSR